MLEKYLELLQLSLEYLEEEHGIMPSEIHEAEISLCLMEHFQGSVLFPELQKETFLSLWNGKEGNQLEVYWMNDYTVEEQYA